MTLTSARTNPFTLENSVVEPVLGSAPNGVGCFEVKARFRRGSILWPINRGSTSMRYHYLAYIRFSPRRQVRRRSAGFLGSESMSSRRYKDRDDGYDVYTSQRFRRTMLVPASGS